MQIDIINEPLNLKVFGFSGKAINNDYADTAFRLMNKMWQVVKDKGLKNKGINIWIYEPEKQVFAGVEPENLLPTDAGLELKNIQLLKYARYKHVGPYSQIKQSGLALREELRNKGYQVISPYIEIYGHWTNDESKLETDLLMNLE